MLILDRTFDLIAPIMHDYNYESMVFDMRDIGE